MPLKTEGEMRKLSPDWAMGLKELYDSVVQEPLPDAFTDLLSRFDETAPG